MGHISYTGDNVLKKTKPKKTCPIFIKSLWINGRRTGAKKCKKKKCKVPVFTLELMCKCLK